MKQDKILITGGSGTLGGVLVPILKKNQIDFIAPSRKELNLATPNNVYEYLQQTQPSIIIHLGAETNVDLCEVQHAHAIRINLLSSQKIADYCKEYNARLIFISTSGVVAGHKHLIKSEIDLPMPLNFYWLTKYRAEEYIQRTCRDYLIIRAAWMCGKGSSENKKFAQKMIEKILEPAKEVLAVYDLYGSITYSKRLAELIFRNMHITSQDVIHCASSSVCSRYDIACYMKNYFKSSSEIIPVQSCQFPLSAPRAFCEGLSSLIAVEKFGYVALTWQEELQEFLDDFTRA